MRNLLADLRDGCRQAQVRCWSLHSRCNLQSIDSIHSDSHRCSPATHHVQAVATSIERRLAQQAAALQHAQPPSVGPLQAAVLDNGQSDMLQEVCQMEDAVWPAVRVLQSVSGAQPA